MALRSVVVGGPPSSGPRRTVVLRTGGPKPKGHLLDGAAGVVGVLLLLGAVFLVQALPDTDYVYPRFKVTYPAGSGESTSQGATFVEGSAVTFEFSVEVPNDNVVGMTVAVSFRDDVGPSRPDVFRVTLFDPLGNQLGQPQQISNPPPTENNSNEIGTIGQFDTYLATAAFGFSVGTLPQEAIVEGQSRHDNARDVLNREGPANHVPTAGMWKVKVELINAGDCPAPTDPGFGDPRDIRLMAACANAEGQGGSLQDSGNDFTLEGLRWSYYATCVEALEVRDPKPLPVCA